MNDSMRQAGLAPSGFLSAMSHEMRTPMTGLMGFTELLLAGHYGELNERQREALGHVLECSRHLLALLNDVLDLSKVEAGKMALEIRNISLEQLLEAGLALFRETARKQGIELLGFQDTRRRTLSGDERRLHQMLCHLISNALKFAPAGGAVEVRVADPTLAERQKIESCLPVEAGNPAPGGTWLIWAVTDTGPGLTVEELSQIFKPYGQGRNAFTARFPGVGLGLALARGIVELHGGLLWAESAGPGQGAAFKAALPLPAGDPACGRPAGRSAG